MHPGVLMRAVESGQGADLRGADRARLADRELRLQLPLGDPGRLLGDDDRRRPGQHWVMGMNWYHRLERRYVEYGSSFEATRAFGLFRALYDLVYNMNLAHLSPEVETVFERLGDAGVRTACTPFLIYRGRHRHEVSLEGMAKRMAEAIKFRHAVWGPDELFYGDLYASRKVPCVPTFSRPGTRDEYSTCVAEELVRKDLYDFMLLQPPRQRLLLPPPRPRGDSVESIAKRRRIAGATGRGRGRARRISREQRDSPHRRPRPDRGRPTSCRSPTRWPRTGGSCSPTPSAPRRPRSRSARPRGRAPSTSSRAASASGSPTSGSASGSATWTASTWSPGSRGPTRRPSIAPPRPPTPVSSRRWSSATAPRCASGPAPRGRATGATTAGPSREI